MLFSVRDILVSFHSNLFPGCFLYKYEGNVVTAGNININIPLVDRGGKKWVNGNKILVFHMLSTITLTSNGTLPLWFIFGTMIYPCSWALGICVIFHHLNTHTHLIHLFCKTWLVLLWGRRYVCRVKSLLKLLYVKSLLL